MDKFVNETITAIVVAIAGVLTWLVRTILTNARKIELLEKEIVERDKRRDEDRQTMLSMRVEIRDDLRELREEMNKLILNSSK